MLQADVVSIVAGPIVTPMVKDSVNKLKEYLYPEKEQKQIINKYLNNKQYESDIARGCNENFSEDCTELAKYLAVMEKYNTAKNELRCIEYQIDLLSKEHYDTTELEAPAQALRNTQTDSTSYCKSLPTDEQQKLFALERRLVITYTHDENYEQEVKNLHAVLHK